MHHRFGFPDEYLMTFLNPTQLAFSNGKHGALSDQNRKILGYYITRPGGLVECPSDGGKKSFLLLLKDSTINDHYSVSQGVQEVVYLLNKIAEQSTAKRKLQAQIGAEDKTKKPRHGPASAKIVVETYWDSPEAKKLNFGNALVTAMLSKSLWNRLSGSSK